MTNDPRRHAARNLGWFLILGGSLSAALPAQLVPKSLGDATKNTVPTRPDGNWRGQAQETIGEGNKLEYEIDLAFAGPDDKLQLTVTATARVPAEGQTLTVKIEAKYAGTFADRKLAMRSETIDVVVVETGEKIPSSPQRVEATLTDGVLQGRVGSDGEGWTTFTAKKAGSGDGKVAKAPAFTGKWTGESREPGPDGREIRYPVTVDFRGEANDLLVEVGADVKYPTEDGGTTPVEYRGTFRGRVVDGELQLRSESVQVRLVAMQRTETLPPQQIVGRITDGVLRGEVRAEGQQPARFELRPADAKPVERTGLEGRDGDERVRDERTDRDDVRGKRGATAYPTLILQRREIADPGMGGVASHTMAVPQGWQFAGGPVWTGNPDNIVTFAGELRTNDGASLQFGPDQLFRYSRTQSQQGVFDDTRGQTYPDGAVARNAPQRPGEVAAEIVVPRLRGVGNVRVVQAERLPKLEEALREQLRPMLEMIERSNAQARNNTLVRSDSNTWLVVERARVRYEDGGVEWEEEVQVSMVGFHGTTATDFMRTENGAWSVSNVRSARAKAGELDARLGAMWVCADSLRETPRWSAAVAEIKLELMKAKTRQMTANLDEIRRRGEAAARSRAELSDMQMASWRAQNDSSDRVQKARIDALGERQDFRSADGNTWTVTNHYDRAFKNPDNSIILTSDPNYRPSADPAVNQRTWEEMQRIDPFAR